LPKNEDGEFELVLGNRQLLSVFFIVVILLGVFFTMGYIVGRNSAPVIAESAPAPKQDPHARAVGSSPEPSQTASPAPAATSESAREAEATPAVSTPAPEPAKTEPAGTSPARTKAGNQPEPGQTYLQLAATSQHEADIMVDVLRKKGFQSLAAEIAEKPGTYRVLVGPIAEGTTNKTRADLQQAGFPGNAAIRRTF
jgi:cell division septation protein DedD